MIVFNLKKSRKIVFQNGLPALVFPLAGASFDTNAREKQKPPSRKLVKRITPILLIFRDGTLIKVDIDQEQVFLAYTGLLNKKTILAGLRENLAEILEHAYIIIYDQHFYYPNTRRGSALLKAINQKICPSVAMLLFDQNKEES